MSSIKSKRLNILIPSSIVNLNNNLEHIGTRIQVAEQTNMDTGDLLIDKTIKSPDNIMRIALDLEIDIKSNLYVRYALIYRNKSNNEELQDNFSVISSLHGDQEGYKFSNVIVSTPYIKTEINTSNLNTNYLKVTLEGFQVLLGAGKHKYTTWDFVDDTGKTVFKREKDEDNLTEILVPYDIFESTKLYLLKAKFVTDTNGYSNYGCFLLNNLTTEKLQYDLQPIKPFNVGQSLFYKANYKISNIRNIAIIIKEVLGDVEKEVFRKDDYTPSRSIEIDSSNLTEGAIYKLYSYAKLNLNGEIVNTTTSLYDTFSLSGNGKYIESIEADYPGKYTKLTNLVLGGNVTVSRELKNGNFIIAKNSSKTFSIFGRYNNTIRDTGLSFEIPDANSNNLYVPYVNVLPLYNDNVMINYCIYTTGSSYRTSIWAIYKIDLVNNKATLLKHKAFEDELFSTAMNSSAVVAKDNSVYYIPARYEKVKGVPDLLPIFKIEYKNKDLVRTTIKEVAIENVYRNLTMCPSGDQPLNQEEFIILGGTNKDGTAITDNNGAQTGTYQYKLLNRNIYKFKVNKSYVSEPLDIIGSLPGTFNLDKYSLSAFLRKDGKIVVFNNSDTGTQYTTSQTFTLDLTKTDNTMYAVDNNESTIDLPFRSTIIGNNGDFIRISYTDENLMYVLLYPHNKLSTYEDDVIVINKNLVVPVGRVVTIENPYLYDSIIIEGTDDDHTGIIKWADQNFIRTLTYKDKIITRDTVVTQAEADMVSKEHLWILDGVKYTVKG